MTRSIRDITADKQAARREGRREICLKKQHLELLQIHNCDEHEVAFPSLLFERPIPLM